MFSTVCRGKNVCWKKNPWPKPARKGQVLKGERGDQLRPRRRKKNPHLTRRGAKGDIEKVLSSWGGKEARKPGNGSLTDQRERPCCQKTPNSRL